MDCDRLCPSPDIAQGSIAQACNCITFLCSLISPWLTFKLFAYIEEGKSLSSDGNSQPTHWERLHFYEDSKWCFIALMHECG